MLSTVSGTFSKSELFLHIGPSAAAKTRGASFQAGGCQGRRNPGGPGRQRVLRVPAGRWRPLHGARWAHKSRFAPERAVGARAGRALGGLPTLGRVAVAGRPPTEGSSSLADPRAPGAQPKSGFGGRSTKLAATDREHQSGRHPGSCRSCLLVAVRAPERDDLEFGISLERREVGASRERHLQPPPHRRPELPIAGRHVSFPPRVRGQAQERPAPPSLQAHPGRWPGARSPAAPPSPSLLPIH